MADSSLPLTGAQLREIRRARQRLDPELTLKTLCDKTGIAPRSLLALERGDPSQIRLTSLKGLARLLDVDPARLRRMESVRHWDDEPEAGRTAREIGPYLRQRREALQSTDARYSLRQVAERIGLNAAYLSLIETGKRPLSEEQILYLADEYDEDPDELLAMTGEIAGDVRGIILRRPRLFAQVIRALADRGDEDIQQAPKATADPRRVAQARAEQTLEILRDGHYCAPGQRRVEIKEDLHEAVAATQTHPPGSLEPPAKGTGRRQTRFEVREDSTLESIRAWAAAGLRPVALNFGNALTPGGNFRQGGRGQEQELVGASGLLACLQGPGGQPFYEAHNALPRDPFYSDHVIYAPEVPVFRDTAGALLPEPYPCAFITAAAVNAHAVERVVPDRRDMIGEAMYARILQVLACAQAHGHDSLILGAWGCGTFGNSPKLIATLFHEALTTSFRGVFDNVAFTIVERQASHPTLSAFRLAFEPELKLEQESTLVPRARPQDDLFDASSPPAMRMLDALPTSKVAASARFSRSALTLSKDFMDQARARYRELRRRVWQEATRPTQGRAERHQANQARLHEQLTLLCAEADLDLYRSPAPEARMRLWRHIWMANRLAGTRLQIAETEIDDIGTLFDDYRQFAAPCWDLTHKGHEVVHAGQCAWDYLNSAGPFAGRHTVANVPRLARLIEVARAFKQFFETHDDSDALAFVTEGLPEEDLWGIQARLSRLGYKSELTSLRLMQDLGFPVIKPDLLITRLFLHLGWLDAIVPDHPPDLSAEDLMGKGPHGTRYLYLSRRLYRPIIHFSNQLVEGLEPQQLKKDIGWVTDNALREFDLFMRAAGQKPDGTFGIERSLLPG